MPKMFGGCAYNTDRETAFGIPVKIEKGRMVRMFLSSVPTVHATS